MKKYICLILIAALVYSIGGCSSDSGIEPEHDQAVVQAYLYAGEPVDDIKITSTLSLSSEDSLAPPVNDADIILIKEGITYQLIASEGDSGYYNYPGSDLIVEEGDAFRIEVTWGGKTAYGETTVPGPPEAVNLSSGTLYYPEQMDWDWIQSGGLEQSRITVNWDTDGSLLHYLVIETAEEDPVPVSDIDSPFGRIGGRFRMVTMPTVNDSMMIMFASLEYLGWHRATVYRVNQEYADLYATQSQDSRDLNEPLTNIVNGLGVFSAFNGISRDFNVVLQ